MASSTLFRFLLFPAFLGFLLAAIGGVSARPGVHFHPCKTLFISYTFSSIKPPLVDVLQNPNSEDQNPSVSLAVFSEFKEFNPKSLVILPSGPEFVVDRSDFPTFPSSDDMPRREIRHPAPFGTFGVSSLRERTKDILSVVVALLFGVGCGALTSATMYLAWSLITNRYENRDYDRDDEDDEDDYYDDVSANKMGYVKVPAAPVASAAVTPTKEVV